MIRSFKHKGLQMLFETGSRRGVPPDMSNRLTLQLDTLNSVGAITDMNLPGYHLHELLGNRRGTWAVTVRANWRLTFSFADSDARDVDFEAYH
jgi:proteic killer suppression protein